VVSAGWGSVGVFIIGAFIAVIITLAVGYIGRNGR